jgi:GxxExxY protein
MIHHRGTEDTEGPDAGLSGALLGAAIEVHRALGPGLLESIYQRCLEHELGLRHIRFEAQAAVDFRYKEVRFRQDYRVDLLVEDRLVVEVKSVDRLLPIHRAQLLTYLRLLDLRLGLLLNFNVEVLAKGVRRVMNGY